MSKIVKRSDKLAFFGVVDDGGNVTFHRMRGFNELATKKGPIEYNRQYVDEEFEQSDVVGYSPSISYAFDQFTDDPVHEDLAGMADKELVGENALRYILMVDLSKSQEGSCPAVKREFAVVCEEEGDSMDAYTYSGSMKVKGQKIFGTATTEDEWLTCTFVAE